MPVSNPSYFPPERGNGSIIGITAGVSTLSARSFLGGNSAGNHTQTGVDDLLILGYHAFDAGTAIAPITDVNLTGNLVIGNNASSACTLGGGTPLSISGPNTIIGFNAAPVARTISSSIIIGRVSLGTYVGNLQQAGTIGGMVCIGDNALGNVNSTPGDTNGPWASVVIGYRAAFGAAGPFFGIQQSVILGAGAAENTGGTPSGTGAQLLNDVVIGYGAGRALGSTGGGSPPGENVVIGSQTAQNLANAGFNVIVGSGITMSNASALHNVIIGRTITGGGGNENVAIGSGVFGSSGGVRNIQIGRGCGQSEPTPFSDRLIFETFDGVTRRAALYADLSTGNVLLGNSTPAINRDFDGAASRNILKLLNGTVGALAPVGGGYFYAAAGALHWVGSAGTDTVIAPA